MAISTRGLLPTKLHPRQTRPRIVDRARLVDELERLAAGPLTVVSGPAGAGKSTAVVAWVEQTALATAWLSLDTADDSPMRFLAYLLAAINRVAPAVGREAVELLGAPEEEELELLVAEQLVIPLAEQGVGQPRVALILDDFHVIGDPRIHRVMCWLLDNQPTNLHLLVLSRGEPPLELPRRRAAGVLGEVGVEALRFRGEEAQRFYAEVMGLEMTAERLAEVEALTEGWPAGAQLVALSLRGEVRRELAGLSELPRGDDRLIADYLLAEVFDQLEPELGEVLLATSLPERICAPLAAALVGEEFGDLRGRAALTEIERANLFLLPLDVHGRWFRFHHLFRDFLRRRAWDRGEPWLRERHRRASIWFAARDLREEAFEHALASTDEALIASDFESWSMEALAHSQTGLVRGWLARLPPALRERRAAPNFLDGWCDVIVGQLRSGVDKLDRAEALLSAEDSELIRMVMAGMGPLLRGAALLRAGQLDEADALAQKVRAALPPIEACPRELRMVHAAHRMHEGLTALERDEPRAASALLEQAEAEMRVDKAGDVIVLAHLSEARRRLGALDEAERCARRALRYAEETGNAQLTPAGLARVALGWVALDRGDAARALAEAEAGVERLKLLRDLAYLVRGAELLARARVATGAREEALEVLDEFLVLLEGTDMRPALARVQALHDELREAASSEPAPALTQAGQAGRGRTRTEGLAPHEELTKRELEVLALVATGLSNRDIAKHLFVSVGTVKTHIHRILGKLDVPNRTHAVHRAREVGLLESSPRGA